MKPGLRLQILVLLGVLMAAAFAPLYFAISAYTEAALNQANTNAGKQLRLLLASSLSGPVTQVPEPLRRLTEPRLGALGLFAVALYAAEGHRLDAVGSPTAVAQLPERVTPGRDDVQPPQHATFSALRVTATNTELSLVVLVPHDATRLGLLNRLLLLYMTLVALGLLVAAYFTITRWIIQPIGELSRAARRVAQKTQPLEVPATRSRELDELAQSFRTMTQRLIEEERALRHKVAEVEQATAQLQNTQAQLVRSERLASVGQLAAGLAHEVGNPLAAMQGLQDLILTGELSPAEQRDFVQRMRKETERINRVLRNLLDFARPSAGGAESGAGGDPGSVEAAVHEVISLLIPQPLLRDVEMVIDVYPDLPNVALRHEPLTQVILNLVLNAAQACHEGGVVRIEARLENAGVTLRVEDNGVGVPSALADRIFDPFVSSKDVGEGSGLGLSVCRGLVESVGGSIALDKSHAPGARFLVTLPAQQEGQKN